MVYITGVQSNNSVNMHSPSFRSKRKSGKSKCENHDTLMYAEKKKHPVTTGIKIQADKLTKAFTEYPKNGFEGSKNANFYQFLTMGMVPYLTGSAMMIGVFNAASKFFDTPAAVNACKLGKKMGIGVIGYGILKTLSKKFIEVPVNMKYGIDVNLPYNKVVYELPEKDNKDNLVKHEYHKVFESVDFPRWDLLYNNESFGSERNGFFNKVAKKLGMDEDLQHSDQKTKPKIKEKVIQTKLFSTLSSYLWAATGVGIAMQKPWETLVVNPKQRLSDYKNYRKLAAAAKEKGQQVAKYNNFVKDFGKRFAASCKEFVNGSSKKNNIAGRILLGSAIGMTLLGNFVTLFDFNKDKGSKTQASISLIDDSKEKVVC